MRYDLTLLITALSHLGEDYALCTINFLRYLHVYEFSHGFVVIGPKMISSGTFGEDHAVL